MVGNRTAHRAPGRATVRRTPQHRSDVPAISVSGAVAAAKSVVTVPTDARDFALLSSAYTHVRDERRISPEVVAVLSDDRLSCKMPIRWHQAVTALKRAAAEPSPAWLQACSTDGVGDTMVAVQAAVTEAAQAYAQEAQAARQAAERAALAAQQATKLVVALTQHEVDKHKAEQDHLRHEVETMAALRREREQLILAGRQAEHALLLSAAPYVKTERLLG